MKAPLWIPSEEQVNKSNMNAFMRYAEELTGKPFASYEDLYNWSVTDIEEFWKSIWVHAGIVYSKQYEKVLSEWKMPGAKWFEGAEFNFAENLLRYRDTHPAIISIRENHPAVRLSYQELYGLVARCAAGLKKLGVEKGDRVAGYVPNVPEAIIAMLAATSIGALWSSCSPDFGLQGVVDRFGQIEPKILFVVESYNYNGKKIDCGEKIEHILSEIPSINKAVLIPEFNDFIVYEKNNANSHKLLNFNKLIDNNESEISFEQLPFDHPVYVMYSSGTTGKPKCIVHGAGGTLLQHFKELVLHTNITRHDIITYYTTCGWMMWNWLVSSLQAGATVLLYEGSPVYPSVSTLWRLIEEEKITVFGTSPKYISLCQKSDIVPGKKFNLSSLKTILSTGSPLSEESFEWVYKNVKKNLQLSSISGGTDIVSCFMLGNPIVPVYTGEIQSRGLGMKVEAFDEYGKSVLEEKGELVCTEPFPSMPVFFWNDPDGLKYFNAYFDFYPGIWRHGDFIKITDTGGIVVYGRSDATLNPGGIRIGTAEIYRIVEKMDEVLDSLVIGQNWKNDVRVILFVVLKEGITLTEEIKKTIKEKIKNEASPRHCPAKIIQVDDIPHTISGKKVELAVSKIIHGEKVDNKDALANPNSLEQYINLPELMTE